MLTTTINMQPGKKANLNKTEQLSIWQHIWGDKFYKRLTLLWATGAILLFGCFKQLYPFADFFSDSFRFIAAARDNLSISMWPIGYSKFLQLVHAFSSYDTLLVGTQYVLIQMASFFFYLTMVYLISIPRTLQWLLFGLMFCNPLLLFVSNYVNSDPLFWAISLAWFTQLIWIIARPGYLQVISHAILILLAFSIRNNAYYYPFISILAWIISRHKISTKVAGVTLSLLPIIVFVLWTQEAAFRLTGIRQYSLFSGWQQASNALYMYPHITVNPASLPSEASRQLDKLTRQYFQNPPQDFEASKQAIKGNFFIIHPDAPLKRYYFQNFKPNTSHDVMVAWGKANPVFAEYGRYLIKKYPIAYIRYFTLPNVVNYFFPPLEKLSIYNTGNNAVLPVAQNWFDYTSPEVTAISFTGQKWWIMPYQILFMFLNFFILGGAVWLVVGKHRRLFTDMEQRIIGLMMALLLLNFVFIVNATINVLRYQLFPMTLAMVLFSILLSKMEFLEKTDARAKVLPQ